MKIWMGMLWIFAEVISTTSIFSQLSTTERPISQFGNSDWRSGASSSRSIMVNLAKSLSSSLKQSMAANNNQVLGVSKSIQELEAAVEELKRDIELNTAKTQDNTIKLAALAQITEKIQDRRDLDEMVWTFNTIVCNASIEMMRQDLAMVRHPSINSSMISPSREPVNTLIEETNNILLSVEEKYMNLSNQINSQEKKASLPPQVSMDKEIIKKMESKFIGLETRFDFLLKNLESALTGEDDDIRRQINHKYEDVAIQANATSSRLSVFEVRVDVLEQLVLDMSQARDQITTQDPLFGHDFSMLGAQAEKLHGSTQRSVGWDNRKPDNLIGGQVNFPGSKNSHSNQHNFESQQANSQGRNFFDSQQQVFELKQAELLGFGPSQQQNGGGSLLSHGTDQVQSKPNILIESQQECQCDELQLKVSELEEELSTLRKNMDSKFSGLQETMTVLQHKIQEVDLLSRGEGPAPCVATKEAANMAGMDVWCMQNCKKGNCPPNLCSCPPKL